MKHDYLVVVPDHCKNLKFLDYVVGSHTQQLVTCEKRDWIQNQASGDIVIQQWSRHLRDGVFWYTRFYFERDEDLIIFKLSFNNYLPV